MQTHADRRGVRVKNRGKYEDVLCGWPLTKGSQKWYSNCSITKAVLVKAYEKRNK